MWISIQSEFATCLMNDTSYLGNNNVLWQKLTITGSLKVNVLNYILQKVFT